MRCFLWLPVSFRLLGDSRYWVGCFSRGHDGKSSGFYSCCRSYVFVGVLQMRALLGLLVSLFVGSAWATVPNSDAALYYWTVNYSPATPCWNAATATCSWSQTEDALIAGYKASNPVTTGHYIGTVTQSDAQHYVVQLCMTWGGPYCTNFTFTQDGLMPPPPPPPCPTAGTAAIPAGQIGYGESTQNTNPLLGVLCDSNQCTIKINSATTIPIGNGVTAAYISEATFTGQRDTSGTCPVVVFAASPKDTALPHPVDTVTPAANTASGVPASQADCPSGSAFGQVNGVNVCSPSGSQQSYVPETTTSTNNGQTSTQTSQTTKTVNADGSVSSSTTVSGTGPNGASSTTTIVNNNGGSSGLGKAPGESSGVQGVDLGPAPIAESGDAPTISGLVPGTGADGAGASARDFTVGSTFTGSGACIADRSVSILGLTVTVPLSQLCPYFDTIYKIVSVMAIFAALRILVM